MIKQTVAYTNLDGQVATEDLYFNLNKAELIDLELEQERSMSDMLKEVGEDPTAKDVLWMLKTFVHRSYGKRSEDGRKFVKNKAVLEDFIDSEPYSEFLWGLINDPKKAMEFITGLMPADIMEQAKKTHPQQYKAYEKAMKDLKVQPEKDGKPVTEENPHPEPALEAEKPELGSEEKSEMVDETESLEGLSREELIAKLTRDA